MMKQEAPKAILDSLRVGLLAFSFGALAVSFGRMLWEAKYKDSGKSQNSAVYGQIPDFELTDRSSKKVSLSDLKGKVWIADFIFTHCAGICPLMSSKMKNLQEQLNHYPDIRFVSFSVDPERDTPEALSQYGGRYQADPAKWFFLTGDKGAIHRLSAQHFHLGVEEIPQEKRVAGDQSVEHSSKFVLVDAEAKIRGYYDSQSETALEKLVQDAANLL